MAPLIRIAARYVIFVSNAEQKQRGLTAMFSRRHQVEEVPEELTDIWSCSSDDCKSWMRDNFAFDAEPACTQCGSSMVKEARMLPTLNNSGPNYKFTNKSH
jgi:hypothetical protein